MSATFYNAGYAYLQLVPSLKGFPEALEAKLKGINPELIVKVKPDLDTTPVETQATEAGTRVGSRYADAFATMVQAKIRAALDALPSIDPDVDLTRAQERFQELRVELEELQEKRIGIDIDPADALIALAEIRDKLQQIEFDAKDPIDIRVDATTASTELDNLLRQVRELDHFTATVDVRLNEADMVLAEAQIEALKRESNGTSVTPGDNNGGTHVPLGAGGGRLGYLALLGAVSGTLGGGAISSAALLAIPVAFTAIAAEATKSDKAVKDSFKDLKTQARDTAEQGFSPLIGSLQKLAQTGINSLRQLKTPLQEVSEATGPLIENLGQGFSQATERGVRDMVPVLNQMKPVVNALSQGFGQLETGVSGFFSRLDKQTAGSSLTSLFGVVQQLLPALASLLNAVTPLGTAIASVLGASIHSAASTLEGLSPILDLVAHGLSSVSGFLGAQAPLVLAALVGVRLLGGGWTNFGAAVARSRSIMSGVSGLFNTQSTQFARLASLVGITTAAENKRAQDLALENQILADNAAAEAAAAKAKAQQAANTAEATAAEAAQVAVLDKSQAAQDASTVAAAEAAVARNKLAQADIALIEADEAAAAAEEALGETSAAASFSILPILGIVAGIAGAFGLFALMGHKSAAATQDVSGQLVQAGSQVQTVNSTLNGSSADLKKYTGDLTKIGSSVQQFSSAYSGSLSQAQAYTDGLSAAQKKLGDTMVKLDPTMANNVNRGNDLQAVQLEQGISVKDLADKVNSGKVSMDGMSQSLRDQIGRYDAYNGILPQAKNALDGVKASIAATKEELAKQGITLSQTQTFWNNYGNTIANNVKNFNDATSGIKSLTDASVAADATFFQAKAQRVQLDQAVTQASQAVTQAQQGVMSADHGVAQAAQGVSDARHQEQQAALGVVQAQQQLQQAKQQEVQSERQITQAQQQSRQAQVALTQAKIDAALAIQNLNRQVTDQGDTEAEARVRLVQAQQAVKNAGLEGRSLASLGAPTVANLNSYQLLLQLQEAQHNLNDQLAQGAQLRNQASQANRAGVAGSSQVIQATQAVAQSQDQLRQAIQSAAQAKQGVQQASQGVADAAYQEKQSHLAVQEASYQEQQAQLQLGQAKQSLSGAIAAKKLAQDNDSRSLGLNTQQGVSNFQMVEQLFENNKAATGSVQDAIDITEQQTTALGFNRDAVQQVIDRVTGLNGGKAVYSVVGEPSINISDLINTAVKAGIDPHKDLGFSTAAVGNARAAGSGIFPTHADGGMVHGPGTGTSDSILAYGPDAGFHRISSGEFVVNAADTARNRMALEHANNGGTIIPAHASGGVVSGDLSAIAKANFHLAEVGATFQAIRSAYRTLGVGPLPTLPTKAPADAQQLGVALPGGGGGFSSGSINFTPSAGVAQWAPLILRALAALHQPANLLSAVEHRMNQESGGNPNAINNWDINAQRGDPSRGLMQTIMSTFLAFGPHGVTPADIYNPYDNIYAGLNYAEHRYPSIEYAMLKPGGYDDGGYLPPGLQMVYNATGRPEPVFNPQQWEAINRGGLSQMGGRITGTLKVNGLDAYIDGRIEAADQATSQLITSGTRF